MTRTAVKQKTGNLDNFFMEVSNTKPYFKAAFEGFAGTGKTYTSAMVAIGLHKKIKSKKPIVMFDTEKLLKLARSEAERLGDPIPERMNYFSFEWDDFKKNLKVIFTKIT